MNISPEERARIVSVTGDDPYRRESLTILTFIKERGDERDRVNAEHFKSLELRIDDLAVVVGGLKADRDKVMALKTAIITIGKAAAAVITAGVAIWTAVFHKSQP